MDANGPRPKPYGVGTAVGVESGEEQVYRRYENEGCKGMKRGWLRPCRGMVDFLNNFFIYDTGVRSLNKSFFYDVREKNRAVVAILWQ